MATGFLSVWWPAFIHWKVINVGGGQPVLLEYHRTKEMGSGTDTAIVLRGLDFARQLPRLAGSLRHVLSTSGSRVMNPIFGDAVCDEEVLYTGNHLGFQCVFRALNEVGFAGNGWKFLHYMMVKNASFSVRFYNS